MSSELVPHRPNASTALGHLAPWLRETLERLPRTPGVYLFKDHEGTILYVGKAKNLHARVRSYFTRSSSDTRAFVPLLEELVGEISTIVTHNEKEALLLENTLIKRHTPRFNVVLRDDKNYLVLRLAPEELYPRLEVTRRIRDDGARYFGPYHSARACRQTLRLINRYFKLRTCSDRLMRTRRRPCLQHQIGRCLAPCVLEVDEEQYGQQVHDVTLLLRGQAEQLLRELEERMQRAAAALEFEHAAALRDQITALRTTQEKQHVVTASPEDQDVVGYYREGDQAEVVVLFVREGQLVGQETFSFSEQEFPDEELLSSFLGQFYAPPRHIPPRILLPLLLEDRDTHADWLSETSGRRIALAVPRRGAKRALLDLAAQNARSSFTSQRQREADTEQALTKLQRRLRLEHYPRRIECYDVSGFHEQLVVASMAVLYDGQPLPRAYRRFRIRSPRGDDFASIYEALCRRLQRAREGEAGWELPDVIVIDGGKAQLGMALAALRDVGLAEGVSSPDFVALAKERPTTTRSRAVDVASADATSTVRPERVFLPGRKDALVLRPHSAELFLLTRVRDEAHRFALAYHEHLRRRQGLRSGLDDIPGIGAKRKRALLKALGSLRRIREASLEELAAVPGMSLRAAEAVATYFRSADLQGEEPQS